MFNLLYPFYDTRPEVGDELHPDFLANFGQPALFTLPIDNEHRSYDFSENHNQGTLNGVVTVVPSGYGTLGAAWQFDGTSSYINFGSSLNIGTNDFSFGCAFINQTPTYLDASLIAKSLYGGVTGRFFLIANDAGNNTLSAELSPVGSTISATAPSSYADGHWHVAVAVVRRKQNLTLYVDGDAVASASLSADGGESWDTSFDLLVGAYNDGSGGVSPAQLFFRGMIAPAFIWQAALSAGQVSALYRSLLYGDPPLFGPSSRGMVAVLSGRNFFVPLTGTLTFTGHQSKNVSKTIPAALRFTGNVDRNIGKSFAAALSFSGNVNRRISKSFTGVLSFSGNVNRKIVRLFSAILSFSGNTNRRIGKNLSSVIDLAGSLRRKIGKGLTGSLSFTGSISRGIAKTLSAVLSFSGALANGSVKLLMKLRRWFTDE